MVMDDSSQARHRNTEMELALNGKRTGGVDLVRHTDSRQAEYEQKPVALGISERWRARAAPPSRHDRSGGRRAASEATRQWRPRRMYQVS